MGGYNCYRKDMFYSQCLTSCPLGWLCPRCEVSQSSENIIQTTTSQNTKKSYRNIALLSNDQVDVSVNVPVTTTLAPVTTTIAPLTTSTIPAATPRCKL